MARTRKEKNLAIVLKLCTKQQEQVGKFLDLVLRKLRQERGDYETITI